MVFKRGGYIKKMERWYYKGKLIEEVPYYKFLGIYFTNHLSLQKTKFLVPSYPVESHLAEVINK